MYHLMLSCLSLALTWFRYHPGCISPVPSVVHLSHCPHCVWIVACVSDRALRVVGTSVCHRRGSIRSEGRPGGFTTSGSRALLRLGGGESRTPKGVGAWAARWSESSRPGSRLRSEPVAKRSRQTADAYVAGTALLPVGLVCGCLS
jgi:hypothetical protein